MKRPRLLTPAEMAKMDIDALLRVPTKAEMEDMSGRALLERAKELQERKKRRSPVRNDRDDIASLLDRLIEERKKGEKP